MGVYYEKLINRIYNILWVYDNNKEIYLETLYNIIVELRGHDSEEFTRIYYKLKGLYSFGLDIEQTVVKKTIFSCIDLVSIVRDKVGDGIVK